MFSIRDKHSKPASVLSNQSGQGLVEYVLVLVVTVGLILGGLYQLNTAFKGWANNYFGNYLACLLESGELPNISGGGGDGGLCNEIFKPFSLAEGRKLNPDYKPPEGSSPSTGGGSRENRRAGSTVNAGGGGGGARAGGGGGGRFTAGSFGKGNRMGGSGSGKKGSSATYTGNMAASDYGSSGGGANRRLNVSVKHRLDNRFAFEEERERPQKRSIAGSMKKPGGEENKAPSSRVKRSDLKKSKGEEVDGGLTLPSLLKYLIIAGIIIALIVFLGGQGLQIGKSME